MLENVQYSPTLFTRVAETKALYNLPAATKDRMFPILVARPWPNARNLERAWEKIEEAFANRPFGLDLDETRNTNPATSPVQQEFARLFAVADGYSNYYAALSDISHALPVLRLTNGDIPDLARQITHADELDRGLILRLRNGQVRQPRRLVREVLQATEDCVIVVDCGWSNDLIAQEVWASNIVAEVTRINPETEIIVSGSSFPNSFVGLGARSLINVVERTVHGNLARQHNAANLTYGDWGSTRPPSPPVPMRNIPRIDLPTVTNWACFRQDRAYDPDETYEQIAQRVVSDALWPNGLNIWGTYTIANTANGLPGGIRSPATATAARVNIHMHRQAYFGANFEVSDADEPYED